MLTNQVMKEIFVSLYVEDKSYTLNKQFDISNTQIVINIRIVCFIKYIERIWKGVLVCTYCVTPKDCKATRSFFFKKRLRTYTCIYRKQFSLLLIDYN